MDKCIFCFFFRSASRCKTKYASNKQKEERLIPPLFWKNGERVSSFFLAYSFRVWLERKKRPFLGVFSLFSRYFVRKITEYVLVFTKLWWNITCLFWGFRRGTKRSICDARHYRARYWYTAPPTRAERPKNILSTFTVKQCFPSHPFLC